MIARTPIELSDESIRQLLAACGFRCERISEDTWRTRFRGLARRFPLLVRVDGDEGIVTFAVVPYLGSPEEPEIADRLYKRLLELNQDLLMAKFSIDDDLDVVLSVEYPTSHLDRSEFEDALDALSFYADAHYGELSALAEVPAEPTSDAEP